MADEYAGETGEIVETKWANDTFLVYYDVSRIVTARKRRFTE